MYINLTDNTPEGKKRAAKIKEVLPEKSLIETMLKPKIDLLYPLLLKMLYAELEIYRNYPKKPLEESGKAKVALKTFDARNHTTCFQGKAFKVTDSHIQDADLRDYRKAVGTFNHAEWGNATLMEIWGGDHMKAYPDMVKQAFKYGANLIKTRPVLNFHVNPLFMNKKTGRTKLTEDQEIYKYDQDLLMAKAMTWGVRTPKEAQRAEDARRARSEKAQAKLDKEYLDQRKKKKTWGTNMKTRAEKSIKIYQTLDIVAEKANNKHQRALFISEDSLESHTLGLAAKKATLEVIEYSIASARALNVSVDTFKSWALNPALIEEHFKNLPPVEIHHKTLEHIIQGSDYDIRHLVVLLIKKGFITLEEFYNLPYDHFTEGEDI